MGWGESIGPLIAASIAHHGRPVEWPADPTLGGWQDLDHYDWRAETRVMDDALRRWFAPAFEAADEALPDEPLLHHAFAGLVALADWIGSDTRFFPFVDPFDPAYDATAHDRALKSLEAVGFDPGALPTGPAVDFHRMTGFYKPNPAVPPPARGYTPRLVWQIVQSWGSPARAGIHRRVHGRADQDHGFPRPRGDTPGGRSWRAPVSPVPPLARGYTSRKAGRARGRPGSPARAGIHPQHRIVGGKCLRFLRSRGDTPRLP